MDKMQTREHVNAFVKWAKENIVEIESFDPQFEGKDLEAIASAIGDEVQIVALSEGCHNNKQMMSLHDRIIRYLIEYCGFTIVATESGLPESKLIHDYVQNKVAVVEDVEAILCLRGGEDEALDLEDVAPREWTGILL